MTGVRDIERRRRAARSGFTLVELMVALTIGGIAVSAIYSIGAVATRQFHQQQQVANAQTTLRIAVNQLKRDIARAGYLATPNAGAPGQSCGAPSTLWHNPPNDSIAAIARFRNNLQINDSLNNNGNVDPTGNNDDIGATVDEVVLLANYATASEYPGVRIASTSNDEITVSSNWYAFRHDFTRWYEHDGTNSAFPFVQDAIDNAFPDGRLIRIRTTTGQSHFAAITDVVEYPSPGPPPVDLRLRINPAIPGPCAASVNNGWVAPLSFIRYSVQNSLDAQRNPGHGPIAQLLRQEVLPTDKVTPLASNTGNTRSIADYVVAFNLAFTMNGATAPNAPDMYAIGTLGADANTPAGANTTNDPSLVNGNPERVRAVMIDLAVRTPEQDPTLVWSTTATGCANLRCFQVSTAPGAARVRRLRAEVFLPNVAQEGY